MNIVKKRIGLKVTGSIGAKPTHVLLGEFLAHEEIWGYNNLKSGSLGALKEEWGRDWDKLLSMVSNKFKERIRDIHPDVNKTEMELASNLTTTFNILKKRIKNLKNPKPISGRKESFILDDVYFDRTCLSKRCGKNFRTKDKRKLYCCRTCVYQRRTSVYTKKCASKNCNIIFTTVNPRKKFCSNKCPQNQKEVFVRTCMLPTCDNVFKTMDNRKVYCSKKCYFKKRYIKS